MAEKVKENPGRSDNIHNITFPTEKDAVSASGIMCDLINMIKQ